MDEEEFRKLLTRRHERHLGERVNRWKQLDRITIDVRKSPDLISLVDAYMDEAEQLFIDGHYLGTILLCAGVAEAMLLDQLTNNGISPKQAKRLGLKDMVKRSRQQEILDDTEAQLLCGLNDLRNDIIHAKVDQLIERGTGSFEESVVGPSPTNYLSPFFGGSVDEDTLTYVKGIRSLVAKFYSPEELL